MGADSDVFVVDTLAHSSSDEFKVKRLVLSWCLKEGKK
jgi:hypothetical protein